MAKIKKFIVLRRKHDNLYFAGNGNPHTDMPESASRYKSLWDSAVCATRINLYLENYEPVLLTIAPGKKILVDGPPIVAVEPIKNLY
jgi:hypothetical protein